MSAPNIDNLSENYKQNLYNHANFRVGTNVPPQQIRFIERIQEQFLASKRFLPDMSTKKRNPRSELRIKSAQVLSHLCHWINLETYDGHDFRTYDARFTLRSLGETLGISESAMQRITSALTLGGYIKPNYVWHARGKSSTQWTLTAKLFSHLRFFRETLIKAATYAKNLLSHKKREKEYVQAQNQGKGLSNKAPYKKTAQNNFKKQAIEIKSDIKSSNHCLQHIRSMLCK